jgi:uncharacterized protein YdaU (DUF1376 family)
MNGLPYYKAYPRDFLDGTAGMDFEVKGAYRILLDLIYMHGGRLVDEPRFIAGHLGCSVKKWNCLRSAILATGKIVASEGYLGNLRADKELDSLKSFQDKQRENGTKRSKNNGISKAMAEPNGSHTDTEPDTHTEGGSVFSKENPPPPSCAVAVGFFDDFRQAVGWSADRAPKGWTDKDLQAHVQRWAALGLTEERIISEASQSRSVHQAPPAKPQALDGWMQRAASKAQPPPPAVLLDPVQRMEMRAGWIRQGRAFAVRDVPPSEAREMLIRNLVTSDDLRRCQIYI